MPPIGNWCLGLFSKVTGPQHTHRLPERVLESESGRAARWSGLTQPAEEWTGSRAKGTTGRSGLSVLPRQNSPVEILTCGTLEWTVSGDRALKEVVKIK